MSNILFFFLCNIFHLQYLSFSRVKMIVFIMALGPGKSFRFIEKYRNSYKEVCIQHTYSTKRVLSTLTNLQCVFWITKTWDYFTLSLQLLVPLCHSIIQKYDIFISKWYATANVEHITLNNEVNFRTNYKWFCYNIQNRHVTTRLHVHTCIDFVIWSHFNANCSEAILYFRVLEWWCFNIFVSMRGHSYDMGILY